MKIKYNRLYSAILLCNIGLILASNANAIEDINNPIKTMHHFMKVNKKLGEGMDKNLREGVKLGVNGVKDVVDDVKGFGGQNNKVSTGLIGFRHSSPNQKLLLAEQAVAQDYVRSTVKDGKIIFESNRHDAVEAWIHDKDGNVVDSILIPGIIQGGIKATYDNIKGFNSKLISTQPVKAVKSLGLTSSSASSQVVVNSGYTDLPEGYAISFISGTNKANDETLRSIVKSVAIKSLSHIENFSNLDKTNKAILTDDLIKAIISDHQLAIDVNSALMNNDTSEFNKTVLTWVGTKGREAISTSLAKITQETIISANDPSSYKLAKFTNIVSDIEGKTPFKALVLLTDTTDTALMIKNYKLQKSMGARVLSADLPKYKTENGEIYTSPQLKFNWKNTKLKNQESMIWVNQRYAEDDNFSMWKPWTWKGQMEAEERRWTADKGKKKEQVSSNKNNQVKSQPRDEVISAQQSEQGKVTTQSSDKVINYPKEEERLYNKFQRKSKELESAYLNNQDTSKIVAELTQISIEHKQLIAGMLIGQKPKYNGFFTGEELLNNLKDRYPQRNQVSRPTNTQTTTKTQSTQEDDGSYRMNTYSDGSPLEIISEDEYNNRINKTNSENITTEQSHTQFENDSTTMTGDTKEDGQLSVERKIKTNHDRIESKLYTNYFESLNDYNNLLSQLVQLLAMPKNEAKKIQIAQLKNDFPNAIREMNNKRKAYYEWIKRYKYSTPRNLDTAGEFYDKKYKNIIEQYKKENYYTNDNIYGKNEYKNMQGFKPTLNNIPLVPNIKHTENHEPVETLEIEKVLAEKLKQKIDFSDKYFNLNQGINEDNELSSSLLNEGYKNTLGYDFTLISNPKNGEVKLKKDGRYFYHPNTNYNGTDSFVFRATDQHGNSQSFTVNIDVAPVNDAITASNLNYNISKNKTLIENLSKVNSVDTLGHVIYSLGSDPKNGYVELLGEGQFKYTPKPDFIGTDSFDYEIIVNGQRIKQSVSINVQQDSNTGNFNNQTNKNQTLIANLPPITDFNGRVIVYSLGKQDIQHGNLEIVNDNQFKYTPDDDYVGDDSFSYFLINSDGKRSKEYTVHIKVLEDGSTNITVTNNTPTASDLSANVNRNESLQAQISAIDKDNDSLSYSIATQAKNGIVTFDGNKYTYKPNLNYTGKDSFEYTVSDDKGGSNTYTVNIDVNKNNDYAFPEAKIMANKKGNFISLQSIANSKVIFEFIDSNSNQILHNITDTTDKDGKLNFDITDKNTITNIISKADRIKAYAVDSNGNKTPFLVFDLTQGILDNNATIMDARNKSITVVNDAQGERTWGGVINSMRNAENGKGLSTHGNVDYVTMAQTGKLTKDGIADDTKNRYIPELADDGYQYIYHGFNIEQFNENELLDDYNLDYDATVVVHKITNWAYGQPLTNIQNTGNLEFEGYLLGSYQEDNDEKELINYGHYAVDQKFKKATGDVKLTFSLNDNKLSGYFDFNKEGKSAGKIEFANINYEVSNKGVYTAEKSCFNDPKCDDNIKLAGFFAGEDKTKPTETGGVFHADNPSGNSNWIEGIFKAKNTDPTKYSPVEVTSTPKVVDDIDTDTSMIAKPTYDIGGRSSCNSGISGGYEWCNSQKTKSSVSINSKDNKTLYGISRAYSDSKIKDKSVTILHNIFDSSIKPQVFRTKSKADKTDNYEYLTWGRWDNKEIDAGKLEDGKNATGHWVYATARTDLPKTGTASYQGNVMGNYIPTQGKVELDTITGDIGLNVDFATSSMDGTMNLKHKDTDWATANFKQSNAVKDSEFNIDREHLTVTGGGNGEIQGFFAGPTLNEIGGSFSIDKQFEDKGFATGIFVGKATENNLNIKKNPPAKLPQPPKVAEKTNGSSQTAGGFDNGGPPATVPAEGERRERK